MKLPALLLLWSLIICCSPDLIAQSGPSQRPQSDVALKRWVLTEKKLAGEGNIRAQEELGDFYYFGTGVPQDFTKAAYWLRKAAEQGDVGAQFEIGDLYFKGRGVPQSYPRAYFWLDLAAAQASPNTLLGNVPLTEMRDEAASHLSRTEVLHVQKRAERWFKSHKSSLSTY